MEGPQPLAGRIAVVTGATRRGAIGAAICRALASAGADVFFTTWQAYDAAMPWGADPRDPELLAAELRELGVYAGTSEFDLSRPDVAPDLFDAVEQWLGAPAILVNNAVYSTNDSWETIDAATLDRHYAVNLRATALLSSEFARRFSFSRGGRIINFTTGIALTPMPAELSYAATKAGIEALTRSLAPDLMARGITVNAVDPGPTDTGWITPQLRRQLLSRFPTGRLGQPDDVARLVAFLVSDEASWITGQIIHSEGGFIRF